MLSIPFFVSLVAVFLLNPTFSSAGAIGAPQSRIRARAFAFLRYLNRGPEFISARPSTKEWIKVIECYQKTLGFFIEKVLLFLRQRISFIKFLFDLPLLEHHNIRPCPFEVNALNVESIIRYPFPYHRTEWKKSNETCDGY